MNVFNIIQYKISVFIARILVFKAWDVLVIQFVLIYSVMRKKEIVKYVKYVSKTKY
jgi:hypothetical protein